MAYVALKPCCFAGNKFKIGDTIPEEMIHPGAAQNLVKMTVIAAQEHGETSARDTTPAENKIELVVRAKEGDMPLKITESGLQSVFDVMCGNVSEAETIIDQMTDSDALMLLHVSDSRKTVKEAAETRAKKLTAAEGVESEGEE